MKRETLHKVVIATYGILLLAGALLALFKVEGCAYVFLTGSILAIIEALWTAITQRSAELAQARRHRLYFIASLFLGIAAWYMLRGSNNWVVMTLIWVVIVLYLSFRSSK